MTGSVTSTNSYSLRRQSAAETVSESTLARNDSGESSFGSQDTLYFSESRGKVVEVLEYVNGYHAIEIIVGIRQALLAIARSAV